MFQSKEINLLLIISTISAAIVVQSASVRSKSRTSDKTTDIIYDQSQKGKENFVLNIKNVHVAFFSAKKESGPSSLSDIGGGLFSGGNYDGSNSPSGASYLDSIKDTVMNYLFSLQKPSGGGLGDEYFKPEFEENISSSDNEAWLNEQEEEEDMEPQEEPTTEITIALHFDNDEEVHSAIKNSTSTSTKIPDSFPTKMMQLLNIETTKPPKIDRTEMPDLQIIQTIKRKTTQRRH
jgi:hypothetical protein